MQVRISANTIISLRLFETLQPIVDLILHWFSIVFYIPQASENNVLLFNLTLGKLDVTSHFTSILMIFTQTYFQHIITSSIHALIMLHAFF
jgi:hypothetical protein